MANNFFKCGKCSGNMWPDNAQGRDHKHLSEEELRRELKLKYRTKPTGRSKAANPRTNSAKAKAGKFTIAPPRRAYGPF